MNGLYKKLILSLVAALAIPAAVQAASAAQTKAVMNVAQQKLASIPEEPVVDAATEKQIEDLINQLVVHKTIADYAQEHDWKKVKELAGKKGIDLNAQDSFGHTALICAAWNHQLEIVRVLLQAGANINIKDGAGVTVLMYAAARGDSEVAKVLIQAGADVNAQDKYDRTALICAARTGGSKIVRVLLQVGANINVKDDNGYTALMHAAETRGNIATARVLIQAGADINARDKYDRTALMCAQRSGHGKMIKYLESLQKQGQSTHIQSKL